MNLADLNVAVRETTGKGAAIKMRTAGMIPAVIYGAAGQEAGITISVPVRELEKVIKESKTSQVFVNLKDANGAFSAKSALLKELQVDPGSRRMLHADFYEITMDKKIRTRAVVTTVGKPAGIDLGGTLKIIARELEIFCAASDVPEKIEINVAAMKLGETILAGDLDLGDKIKVASDSTLAVVTLIPPKRTEAA